MTYPRLRSRTGATTGESTGSVLCPEVIQQLENASDTTFTRNGRNRRDGRLTEQDKVAEISALLPGERNPTRILCRFIADTVDQVLEGDSGRAQGNARLQKYFNSERPKWVARRLSTSQIISIVSKYLKRKHPILNGVNFGQDFTQWVLLDSSRRAQMRNAGTYQNGQFGTYNPGNNTGVDGQLQGRNISPRSELKREEQNIIVGHLCSYAAFAIDVLLRDNPCEPDVHKALHSKIRVLWSQWINLLITREQLLNSIVELVKGISPNGEDPEFLRGFKDWYNRSLNRQQRLDERRGRQQLQGSSRE